MQNSTLPIPKVYFKREEIKDQPGILIMKDLSSAYSVDILTPLTYNQVRQKPGYAIFALSGCFLSSWLFQKFSKNRV